MMAKNEKKDVYKVYDKIANWFALNRSTRMSEAGYLNLLIDEIPANGNVLDLGCGTGKPILGYLLTRGLSVTGVDGSERILEIASANFPSTEFIRQDMRSMNLNKRFDAIIAWDSFFHLPAEDQPAMFAIFEGHLNPGGVLIFTSGTEHGEAWGMNGGENLFHASLDQQAYQDLLAKHHFQILKYAVNDPDCDRTVWMAKLKH